MASAPLAFTDDAGGRALPWAVAAMVFLAMLAVAGAVGIGNATAGWRAGVEDRLTVRIAAIDNQPAEPRIEIALGVLFNTQGVSNARVLTPDEIGTLLKPWLGGNLTGLDLPLPALIDVTLEPDAVIDTAALTQRLQTKVPGAHVEDPTPWLGGLLGLARVLQTLAGIVVALTSLAMVAMVVAATRAGLAAQTQTIEVLHVIGAQDGYIARAFVRFVLRRAALGAVLGALGAGLSLVLLSRVAAPLGPSIFPDFSLDPAGYGALAAVPAVALMLAVLTAHYTVLGQLRRMT